MQFLTSHYCTPVKCLGDFSVFVKSVGTKVAHYPKFKEKLDFFAL